MPLASLTNRPRLDTVSASALNPIKRRVAQTIPCSHVLLLSLPDADGFLNGVPNDRAPRARRITKPLLREIQRSCIV